MDFFQQKQKQKYLILILPVIILAIVFVMFFGKFFEFSGEGTSYLPFVLETEKIEINWEVLEDPRLKELQIFE